MAVDQSLKFNYKDVAELESLVFENVNTDEWNKLRVEIELDENLPVRNFTMMRGLINVYILNILDQFFTIEECETMLFLSKGSSSDVTEYLDSIILKARDKNIDITTYSMICESIVDSMSQIAFYMDGHSFDISIFDVFDLMSKSERAKEILLEENHINQDMSAVEIVKKRDALTEEMATIIHETKSEPFHTLIEAGAGMRMPQFVESTVMVGCNPDFDTMIPYEVRASWLRGVADIEGWYVASASARHAKILEKIEIDKTGTALKEFMFANKGVYANPDKNSDCGSQQLITRVIKDTKDLSRYIGVYYKEETQVCGFSRVGVNDTFLIGRVIHIRNPATCNAPDGKVCHICTGIDLRDDVDIALDTGLKEEGEAGQDFLSAKHNNKADPVEMFDAVTSKYIKCTIRNKIKFLEEVSWVRLVFSEEVDGVANSKEIEFELKSTGEIITAKIDSKFYTPINNLEGNDFLKDFDKLNAVSINVPKAVMFGEYRKLFWAKKEDSDGVPVEDMINRVIDVMSHRHVSLAGIMMFSFIRDENNIFKRPDFTADVRNMTFVNMGTLKRCLPINESLPQGPDIGIKALYTSVETFDGTRETSNVMDPLLVSRINVEEIDDSDINEFFDNIEIS